MIKQLSIFLENRAGALARITELLAQNEIDLRALFIAETTDYGVLRVIVSDAEKAVGVLKNNGVLVEVNEVLGISVPDKPGGLAEVLKLLSDNGIDVAYMYSMFGKNDKKAHMIFRVADNAKMEKVLGENGIMTESADDLK